MLLNGDFQLTSVDIMCVLSLGILSNINRIETSMKWGWGLLGVERV